MCSHSLSALDITGNIMRVLYPRINEQFSSLKRCNKNHLISKEAICFYDMIDSLFKEFESLSNYEEKLVFPSILKVFNTKDDPGFKAGVDINELRRLMLSKENCIKEIVEDLEIESDALSLQPLHPVYKLLHIFQQDYAIEKAKWYYILENWSNGCACFIKAGNMQLINP